MTKLNENHYAVKLFREMVPYGIERIHLGAVTATLQYPDDDIGTFTLSLINFDIRKGVVFNILKNPVSITIIESKVSGKDLWYEQMVTIPSAKL